MQVKQMHKHIHAEVTLNGREMEIIRQALKHTFISEDGPSEATATDLHRTFSEILGVDFK